jgi:hypothetical protein
MKRSNEQGSWFPRPFMRNKVGRYCNRPLMKIDRYGEVLIGCIDCNRWGHPRRQEAHCAHLLVRRWVMRGHQNSIAGLVISMFRFEL